MDYHPEAVPKRGQVRVNRRRLLRLMSGGIGGAVGASLLAARGGSSAAASTASTSSHVATTSGQSTTPPGSAGTPATLVVAANFVITSLDPGRTVETTSEMIDHSTYDSLVTFEGADLATPKPSLASKWVAAADGKSYTFTLRSGVKFASGNPLTSADVKWSLDRVKNLNANPAFFMAQIDSVEAPAPDTVVIRLRTPFPGIIPILSSPSLGVIDSKLVTTKGGDASVDAATKDKAETYLNQHSAGTGPFTMTSYMPGQQVRLVKNPNYWRGAPSLGGVVLQDITDPASEKTQLVGGSIDIATALTQDALPSLQKTNGVVAKSQVVASTFYILMNNNPSVGGAFSNPKIQQAVRYALDYQGILALAGSGAQRLAGVIPNVFPGALPLSEAISTNQAKAKSLIAEANVGKVTGKLSFSSDGVQYGIPYTLFAQKIQTDLNAVGMDISLDGLPDAPALAKYRGAKDQIAIWSWTADYPDASDYMVYAPGNTVGKRAGWAADASPVAKELAALAAQAISELDTTKRTQLYQEFCRKLNTEGPYVPLFLPAAPYGYRSNIDGVTLNSVWGVDFYPVTKSS